MSRIDQKMVELGLVPSRSKAQELIRSGQVEILRNGEWRVVTTAGAPAEHVEIRIRDDELLQYVSRGGLKLKRALADFRIVVKGCSALDVGLSTGGFSDCLLQQGATRIVGVDVGRDQVADKLKGLITVFEKTHTRDLRTHGEFLKHAPFDLLVMDVSFISCLKVLPDVLPFLKSQGEMLILIKPQFELGESALNKKGLVKDVGLYQGLQVTIVKAMAAMGLHVLDYKPCRLKGQDGNQEFFLHARQP